MKLLQAIERRTDFFGATATLILARDYPLGYCKNETEFEHLMDYLASRGFVAIVAKRPARIESAPITDVELRLTAEGYAEIEGREASNLESDQVFVAMSFDPKYLPHYVDAIKPAIEESGFRSVRIDAKEYNGDLVDEIIVEVRKSRFVVADTAGHRGGVYFEAGYARTLGFEVIFSCPEGEFDHTHFDVSHMNHIVWKTTADLREKLARRIQSTIGFGPLKGRPS
jgi:hypothetical protein